MGQGRAETRSQPHHVEASLGPEVLQQGDPGAQASPPRQYKGPGPMGFLCIISTQGAPPPEDTLRQPHSYNIEHILMTGDSCCPLCQRQHSPGSSPWNSTLYQGTLPPPLAPLPAAPFSLAFYTDGRSCIPGQCPPGRSTQRGVSEPPQPQIQAVAFFLLTTSYLKSPSQG